MPLCTFVTILTIFTNPNRTDIMKKHEFQAIKQICKFFVKCILRQQLFYISFYRIAKGSQTEYNWNNEKITEVLT